LTTSQKIHLNATKFPNVLYFSGLINLKSDIDFRLLKNKRESGRMPSYIESDKRCKVEDEGIGLAEFVQFRAFSTGSIYFSDRSKFRIQVELNIEL